MTGIGVNATTKQRLRSLTARGLNGCKKSRRNSFNSLALADEFSLSNRGKKSTAPGCISPRRLRSPLSIGRDALRAFQRERLTPEHRRQKIPSSAAISLRQQRSCDVFVL